MKKKIKELNQKEIAKLNKMLGECDIITFNEKKVTKQIQRSYKMREQAHDLILKADILLDEVLKELYGTTNQSTNKEVK